MKSVIIGVAGHIDHGKTSLIKALNGFDGDSLPDEKKRGITLELSFSHLRLGELHISFIDVPGHHKLIKHLIAGAFGFDYLLLVVDSCEGIMPQTIEHLRIASFLGVKDIICVLSKSDKSNATQQASLKQALKTLLAPYPIKLLSMLEVSIYDTKSLSSLQQILATLSPKIPPTPIFRYYIDRSFHIAGAGCVVSGTLLGGEVQKKDSLRCFDLNRDLEIKAINIHNQEVTHAKAPARVALNLSNIKAQELKRGYLLGQKGYLRGFKILDVWLEFYDHAPKHGQMLTLYIGSRKLEVKLLWLTTPKDATPHTQGMFATLQAKEDIFALFNEAFILKDEGVLAGGRILNPIADPMNKAQKIALLQALKSHELHHAFKILLQAHQKGFGVISAFQRFALSQQEALNILQDMKDIFIDEKALIAYPISQIESLKQEIRRIFKKNPNALISAQSLSYKFIWASIKLLESTLKALCADHEIRFQEGLYLSEQSSITNIQDYIQTHLYNAIEQSRYVPLAPQNLYDSLDIDYMSGNMGLKALCKAKKIIRLNSKLFITPQNLSSVLAELREIITTQGYVDIHNAKPLGLSRKYLIAYLEQLDHFGDITTIDQKRYLKAQHD